MIMQIGLIAVVATNLFQANDHNTPPILHCSGFTNMFLIQRCPVEFIQHWGQPSQCTSLISGEFHDKMVTFCNDDYFASWVPLVIVSGATIFALLCSIGSSIYLNDAFKRSRIPNEQSENQDNQRLELMRLHDLLVHEGKIDGG